jgi:hypothetical protein
VGEHGRLPWEPDRSTRTVVDGNEFGAVDALEDTILRADVGDAVDGSQYPDATYWRFGVDGIYAKRFVVLGERVASITLVFCDGDAFTWATRTTPPRRTPPKVRDLSGHQQSLARYRPTGWLQRLFRFLTHPYRSMYDRSQGSNDPPSFNR